MENKVKAWGIEQAVWGRDTHEFYWFASKEERDKYAADHDHLDKLRCRMVDKDDVFETYEAWLKWDQECW